MKKIAIAITLLIFSGNLMMAQNSNQELKNYLKDRQQLVRKNEQIVLKTADYENDYFFFGFIHGSRKTQELDFQLFKSIRQVNKMRYYAAEVGYSMAYFFNKYLITGDEALLYDLVESYRFAVPQDASVQFYEKWKKLKLLNDQLPADEKIHIMGFDRIVSSAIFLKHMQELLSEVPKGTDVVLDSIKSMDYEQVNAYSLYDKDSDIRRFFEKHFDALNQSKNYQKLLAKNYETFNHLLWQVTYFFDKKSRREERIFQNFQRLMAADSLKDEKVYFNYGFAHVMQEDFYNNPFIAKLLKNHYQHKKVFTCLVAMSESSVLWNAKYTKEGKYKGYGINWFGGEGDSFKERVNGIEVLKRVSPRKETTIYDLTDANSPARKDLYFVLTRPQIKKYKSSAATTDYFQYLMHVRRSKANEPVQELVR